MQLSEFYEITARSGDDTIRRIIMIPTSGFPDDRESAAVNSVVKDRSNRVNYYALMAICDVARKKYGTPVWSEQNEKY